MLSFLYTVLKPALQKGQQRDPVQADQRKRQFLLQAFAQ